MSLSQSPKVKYTPSGKPPERRSWKRPLLTATLILFFVIGAGLNIYALLANNTVNQLAATDGQLGGLVQNEAGDPLPEAVVFVAASPNVTTTTGIDGRFQLVNVAIGEQYLVVVYNEIGQGYVVNIDNQLADDTYTYSSLPRSWR